MGARLVGILGSPTLTNGLLARALISRGIEASVLPARDLYSEIASDLGLEELAAIPHAVSAWSPMFLVLDRASMQAKEVDAMKKESTRAKPGDVVAISGRAVGDTPRLGKIVEVLGGAEHEHYRVRWEDEHESIFYPGNDVVIRQRERVPRAGKAAR